MMNQSTNDRHGSPTLTFDERVEQALATFDPDSLTILEKRMVIKHRMLTDVEQATFENLLNRLARSPLLED